MRRIVFVLGVLITATGVASAGKPTIAILGLEVIGSDGDAKTTQFAKDLTEALRSRPKAGTGPYTLAPGSDKDLLELKLLSKCESEAPACMAAIGKDLAADRLLYGRVEKRSTGYQLSLRLLDVGTKAVERSTSDIVAYADSTGASLFAFAKKSYAKLAGVTDQGSLVVKANVDRGTVYLDGQPRGSLSAGAAQIAGLSEGKYKLRIEAQGHAAYETTIMIHAGETTTTVADLERRR